MADPRDEEGDDDDMEVNSFDDATEEDTIARAKRAALNGEVRNTQVTKSIVSFLTKLFISTLHVDR